VEQPLHICRKRAFARTRRDALSDRPADCGPIRRFSNLSRTRAKELAMFAKMSLVILGVFLTAGLLGCESTQSLGGRPNDNLSSQDNNFFKDAAVGGQFEIQSSQLALQNSNDAGTKRFAQHMIDDHTMVANNLQTLAARKSVELPRQLDTKHQKLVDELNGLRGSEFDRQYAKDQVAAHEETIHSFQKEADHGEDRDIKDFASRNVGTLQSHLSMAKNLPGNGGSGM
jgi:putative membrane protein